MRLENFSEVYELQSYNKDYLSNYRLDGKNVLAKLENLRLFLDTYEGAIYDDGLLRIHNIGSFYKWTDLVFTYFKEYVDHSYCFAFDWVGRQYAVNYSGDGEYILMIDPATLEVFEVEASIEEFFNDHLAEAKEDVLEFSKFKRVSPKFSGKLKFDHCIGFIKPLFLGGKDDVENLEECDMEVYWELNYQMYLKSKNLKPGTSINLNIK